MSDKKSRRIWFRFRRTVLFEAGAAIIFFGSLIAHPELLRCGTEALMQLQTLGYTIPTDSEPVRVYPEATDGAFTTRHAGGWRPGVISLRESPQAGVNPEIYLRHELMHEAAFRTCNGKLPLWAQEAAAINFSGELASIPSPVPPDQSEIEYLHNRVRIGADLDPKSYQTLLSLVALHGWPQQPCEVSPDINRLLSSDEGNKTAEGGFSYILISAISGRVYESKGDLSCRYPPGSLLKLPYAASVKDASAADIGQELAQSDTEKLLKRGSFLDMDRFRLLTSMVHNSSLGRETTPDEVGKKDENLLRPYLGERMPDGLFPLEADLLELALMARASLLSKPDYFYGLADNGFIQGSTLWGESEKDKKILKKLDALCKTGTISDSQGNPIAGHLMVAWPAASPEYLAIFRTLGSNGASNIRLASKILETWANRYRAGSGTVRVRLLTPVTRKSWEIADTCPGFDIPDQTGGKLRVSVCGNFMITSSAQKSRKKRIVSGVLKIPADNRRIVLETDPETYADAVMLKEASNLKGEAKKAMRAVVAWNGLHGDFRHPETGSLCDCTHCMVFMGTAPDDPPKTQTETDPALIQLLDKLTFKHHLNWLSFSKGGHKTWAEQFSDEEVKRLLKEPAILDIRRERTKSGEILIHLLYPETEEVVSCEVFRNTFKLPSCPQKISRDEASHEWTFEGIGQGHGLGLSIDKVQALGQAGYSAKNIIIDAFGEK